MEKNSTYRKAAAVVNIAFIGSTVNSSDIAQQLSQFIDPEGTDSRKFEFSFTEAAAFGSTKHHDADLYVITAEDEAGVADTLRVLKKNDIPFAKIIAENENLIDKQKQMLADLEKALDMGFSVADFTQIHSCGIPIENIRKQLVIFKNGIAKTVLQKPATLSDGIYSLTQQAAHEYAASFDAKKDSFRLTKFVPASGAASRMFKFLCEFIDNFDPEKETINAYINRRKDNALNVFLAGIDKFPFFRVVLETMKQDPGYPEWSKNMRYYKFIEAMLDRAKFDYANKPKGILPFHQYDGFSATPVYEHLKESVAYGSSREEANVHFTISEEHLDAFLDAINDVKEDIEKESGVKINFSFSYQHKYTDTIAVDMNNIPFRVNGRLFFRPGGHGALIENLGNLDADIVFVKNIDNVSHNNIKTISLYKKALAGILMELQEKVFDYLDKVEAGSLGSDEISEVLEFAKHRLNADIPKDIAKYTDAHKLEFVEQLLNKPLRVCGMVKNEGEPGGGPFWVKEDSGKISLQIVESSQVDLEDKKQNEIFAASTHFNPVDLVCSLKNYKGEYFNLNNYVDSSTGFIVYKNRMGKDVKSYELPGLWNGAMACWNTVFVEVPLETFNPVKTVNDLLKPSHQPYHH